MCSAHVFSSVIYQNDAISVLNHSAKLGYMKHVSTERKVVRALTRKMGSSAENEGPQFGLVSEKEMEKLRRINSC